MDTSRQHARFLAVGAIVTLAGALCAAALVLLVDPYRLYRLVEAPGFNQAKPQPERYQKQIKLHGARMLGANVLILGNSRAELGFDPEHPALAAPGASAYNLALAGTRLRTARAQLEELAGGGMPPGRVVVGVEFLDFLVDPRQPSAPRTGPEADDGWNWRFDALFSLASLADAAQTVRLQRLADGRTMTERGFNPLFEYRRLAREEGYHAIFRQRAGEYARAFIRKPNGLLDRDAGSSELDDLRAILRQAAQAGAELHLAIYPYHVQMLAMLEEAGLAPALGPWKAMLAREVAAVRRLHPASRITLWDFSGYSPFQCEPIPAKGDRKGSTRWYWEAGHFKSALGDVMLSRMLGAGGAPADGFGFALDEATLDANEERMRRERAACVAAQPALFQEARALVAGARKGS